MSFIHLHNHTHYSLLDGATKIDEFVDKAVAMNMNALAITDHGNMFGVFEFYKKAKAAGIKPIIGMEAYVAPYSIYDNEAKKDKSKPRYFHLVLLAKNRTGYNNLMKLSSIAYLDGFYYKPRIDKELLKQYGEGLIASSACMHGEIFYQLNKVSKEAAVKSAEEYLEIFGDDFYLEIQDHNIPEEIGYEKVYQLGKEMNIPVIATNDIHYLEKEHAESHDILLCLQTGKDFDDPNRMRYGTDQLYMKTPEEMYALFKDKPEVLERTAEIAEKCNVEIDTGDYKLPVYPLPEGEKNETLDTYLEKLTRKGLSERYETITPEIEERLNFELETIKKMGFSGYFLITQDFINYAKENDIPVGLGRGSAAGSLVAYTLGITGVDPLRYNLLFERFLNPHRQTMPDIDIDFCYERREEVIDYVRQKYGGEKNVVQIITFGTMASKGVIKDVARVLKINYDQANAISKEIPVEGGKPKPLKKALEEVPELKSYVESGDQSILRLFKHAVVLEGLARHSSIHAAGVIIAPGDITDYVPVYKSKEGDVTTQWTMTECEEVGLLKMDFLGLRTLTVIHHALKFVEENHGIKLDMDKISLTDKATFDLFSRGDTVAVFQFESQGMQEYLRKLKPENVENLVALNALYRPGPMDNIDTFIHGKENPRDVEYLHPLLEPILKETYGIIVYQEQVMLITAKLAGFSLAEADIMRKAMGKKKEKLMRQFEDKFLQGCVNNGIEKAIAEEIWALIVKFAKYGFNKSHSVAYATIAYHTAYLKANFPSEYMAATLNSEIDKWEKVQFFIKECRRMGIKVLPPDVNTSMDLFTPLPNGDIVFGLTAIKNVGTTAVRSILQAREKVKKFTDFFEFMLEIDTRLVNKRVLESLIVAGALDSLKGNRRQKYIAIDEAIEFASKWNAANNKNTQPTLFDSMADEENPLKGMIEMPTLQQVEDWSYQDKLKNEKNLFGFYFSRHPLDKYKIEINSFNNVKFEELDNVHPGANVKLAGFIERVNIISKDKGKMAYFTLAAAEGKVEGAVFYDKFALYENLFASENILFISGYRSKYYTDKFVLVANEVLTLDEIRKNLNAGLCVKISGSGFNRELYQKFAETVRKFPGEFDLVFKIDGASFQNGNGGNGSFKELSVKVAKYKISMNDQLLDEAKRIFGDENVTYLGAK